MKKYFILLAILILAITIYSQAVASGKVLVGFFVYDIELDLADPDNINQTRGASDAMQAMLLSEAYYTYSGLIYGYRFTYRLDTPNPLDGFFELKLINEIDKNDERLKILSYQERALKAILETRYYLSEDQKARFDIREHSTIKKVTSRGQAKANNRLDSRIKAIEDSLKRALLAEVKRKYKTRPFSLSGEIFFTELPRLSTKNAQYHALTKLAISIDQIDMQLTP